MTPYATPGGAPHPAITLYHGDVLACLQALPAASVHCIVTSPPYFGLRDYGTAQWHGGDPLCDHRPRPGRNGLASSTLGRGKATTNHQQEGYAAVCGHCGARRIDQQLGLEATLDCAGWATGKPCEPPQCYVCTMVQVGRALWRILRDDGTFWCNLGSCWREKQEQMVPARVALALQAAGWTLRQDIAWVKTAPMPESVHDRFTSSWEHVFLLTKQPTYFFDLHRVREPSVSGHGSGNGYKRQARLSYNGRGQDEQWTVQLTRQMRNSWVLNPEPYAGSHFAVFPTELVRRCVLAGSPVMCCAACGTGYRRVVERYRTHNGVRRDDLGAWRNTDPGSPSGAQGDGHWRYGTVTETQGFAPACECGPGAGTTPSVALDPFVGSGTTCLVALKYGRASIGIDLNRSYLDLAVQRLTPALAQLPLFALG